MTKSDRALIDHLGRLNEDEWDDELERLCVRAAEKGVLRQAITNTQRYLAWFRLPPKWIQ